MADHEVAEEQVLMDGEGSGVTRPAPSLLQQCAKRFRREYDSLPTLREAVESLLVTCLRFVIYASLLIAVDAGLHHIGILDGYTLYHNVTTYLRYLWTGVYCTDSADLSGESVAYANHLQLRPGMTICEMGSADGALLALVGKHVMPGGKLVATAPRRAELRATAAAVARAGLGEVHTHLATNDEWAPGLPLHACDAIYSRMVVHMVSDRVIERYIPQWARSLKPGGRMFVTDHNPIDSRGAPITDAHGRQPIEWKYYILPMMSVLPQQTEVARIVAGGPFRVLEGPFDYPYYAGGYGAVYVAARAPATPNATLAG